MISESITPELINTTTVEEVKGDQQVHETLATLRDVKKRLSYCAGRQEIYYYFDVNFNFRVIAKLNKKERNYIATIVKGTEYGESILCLIIPSVRSRVSEYMLAFGDYISVKVEAEEKDPMFKNYTHNI